MFLIKSSRMNTLQWMSFPIVSSEWQNKAAVSDTPHRAAPACSCGAFPERPLQKLLANHVQLCLPPGAAFLSHNCAILVNSARTCMSVGILEQSGCFSESDRAQQLRLPECPCARCRDGNRGRPLGSSLQKSFQKITWNYVFQKTNHVLFVRYQWLESALGGVS